MNRHQLKEWIIATRPWSFPASAMPIIATVAYLFWTGADMHWGFALWTLVNMVTFHIAGNLWSDYNDFIKKVDREPAPGGSSIPSGLFAAKEIRNFAIAVLAIGVAGGIGLVALTGLELLWIGIAGAALTLLYPLLKYNALGDLDILMNFAILPTLGTSFAVTGTIDWNVLWIAIPVGLITDGILHSNNTRDMVSDKVAEIRTMAMGLGTKASAWVYSFQVLFPYVWIAVCSVAGLVPLTAIIVFLTLPVALGCSRTMMKSISEGAGLIADLDVRTANLQLIFSTLLSLALVADKFI